MSRAEIRRKFDAIVAFAEVEKFIDTPVKRYSSGMYVRLAFAVAAHLEPEILIVDEVLAVGDVEFQKKCLGKMQDVAGQGRTILFVSHNMAAVAALTQTAIVLHLGRIALIGPTAEAMKTYSALAAASTNPMKRESWGRGQHTCIRTARLLDGDGVPTDQYIAGTPFKVEIEVETDGSRSLSCELLIVDQAARTRIALATLHNFEGSTLPAAPGVYRLLMSFSPLHLAAGRYAIDVLTSIVNQKWDHHVEAAISFEVLFSNPAGLPWSFQHSAGLGAVALPFARPTVIERIHDGKTVDATFHRTLFAAHRRSRPVSANRATIARPRSDSARDETGGRKLDRCLQRQKTPAGMRIETIILACVLATNLLLLAGVAYYSVAGQAVALERNRKAQAGAGADTAPASGRAQRDRPKCGGRHSETTCADAVPERRRRSYLQVFRRPQDRLLR